VNPYAYRYHWVLLYRLELQLQEELWESEHPPIPRLGPDWPPPTSLDLALAQAKDSKARYKIKCAYGYFNALNHTL